MTSDSQSGQRATTVLGWLVGGLSGFLLNYLIYRLVGPSYPTAITTFVLFAGGAFGGMAAADRLGPRAVKWLGISAGTLLALILILLFVGGMSSPGVD